MAFRWRANDGPMLNAGLVALCFFRGSGPALLKPLSHWTATTGDRHREWVAKQSPVICNFLACVAKWRKVVPKILNMFKNFKPPPPLWIRVCIGYLMSVKICLKQHILNHLMEFYQTAKD